MRKTIESIVRQGACDLHVHTTASDGSDSPEQMLDRVLAAGLQVFAITDHDSVAGIRPCQAYLARLKKEQPQRALPRLIPGVELSTDLNGEDLHLLGYFPEGGWQQLEPFLEEQIRQRNLRNKKLLTRLDELGLSISAAEFYAAGDGAIGRTQIAQLLVKQGYVASIQAAFTSWLSPGQPAYIERQRPSIEEAIQQIRQAGGLAVLAHPALYGWCSGQKLVSQQLLGQLAYLKQAGLAGVEAWHGQASQKQQDEIAAAGLALDLVLTAGSDDHGSNKDKFLLYDKNSSWQDKKTSLVTAARHKDQSLPARYLICRRSGPGPLQGFWELPGGKVEPGESAAAALRRELAEELTVEAQIGQLEHVLWHDYASKRVVLAIFSASFASSQIKLQVHDAWVQKTAAEALAKKLLPADIILFKHLAEKDGPS